METRTMLGMRRWMMVAVMAVCLPLGGEAQVNAGQLMKQLAGYDSYYPSVIPGVLTVNHNEKVGLIDSTGRWVLPVKYNALDCSVRGVIAAERDSAVHFFNYKGRMLGRCAGVLNYLEEGFETGEYHVVSIMGANGLYGLADSRGRMVQPCRYEDYIYAEDANNLTTHIGDTLFVFDSYGKLRFKSTRYTSIQEATHGRHIVHERGKEYNVGLVDADMRELLPCQYFGISYSNEADCYEVRDSNHRVGLLDADLKVLFPCQYYQINILSPTLFALQERQDGPHVICNRKGQRVGDGHEYVYAERGHLISFQNHRRGIIDSTGRWLLPCRYGYLQIIGPDRAVAHPQDSTSIHQVIALPSGKVLAEYDEMELNLGCACHPVRPTYAAVRRGDRWGYVDSTLREVVAPQYPYVHSSTTDLMQVMPDDSTVLLIDTTGRILLRAEGYMLRLFDGVYSVVYSDGETYRYHQYIVTLDGRTNATPDQRAAARRDTRRVFQQNTKHYIKH